MTLTLEKIAEIIGATLIGNSETKINGISTLTNANGYQISYAVSAKYINSLSKTKAGAVILPKKLKEYCPTNSLIVDDAYLAFAIITHQFKYYNLPIKNSSSKAIIDSSTSVENVTIGAGCVIGKKGFGFSPNKDENYRYPQIGAVIINDNSEIGCGSTIDRGSMSNTVIGKNTFLDNQIHIAHNVKIGDNCIIAGQVGFAGSSSIGNNVMIGGQAGISGHLKIGKNVKIGGASGVTRDIPDNYQVMGYPAVPLRDFVKTRKKSEK